MLPPHAPLEYADRNTLWNAAEAAEKQWNAQLARRIIVAIPKEIPLERYVDLIRDYCRPLFQGELKGREIQPERPDCRTQGACNFPDSADGEAASGSGRLKRAAGRVPLDKPSAAAGAIPPTPGSGRAEIAPKRAKGTGGAHQAATGRTDPAATPPEKTGHGAITRQPNIKPYQPALAIFNRE